MPLCLATEKERPLAQYLGTCGMQKLFAPYVMHVLIEKQALSSQLVELRSSFGMNQALRYKVNIAGVAREASGNGGAAALARKNFPDHAL